MIIRILEDGQFELDEQRAKELEPLDDELGVAIGEGDESAFKTTLESLIAAVHRLGRRLDPATILPSDLAIPAADSTLEEARALLESDAVLDQ